MNHRTTYLLIAFLSPWCLALFAQGGKPFLKFQRISIEEGLSSRYGRSIVQDDEGFIWVGTKAGLNRYDGYEFKRYLPVEGDSLSLLSPDIYSLLVDRDGLLWVGTTKGLYWMDREKEEFHLYTCDFENSQLLNSRQIYCYRLMEDSEGFLWVGSYENGLFRIDRQTNTCVQYPHDPDDSGSLGHNGVGQIIEDSQGKIWVLTVNKREGILQLLDKKTESFQMFSGSPDDPENAFGWRDICGIYEDTHEQVWIGSDRDGILKLDANGKVVRRYSPNVDISVGGPMSFQHLFQDQPQSLWIGTYGKGLIYFDGRSERFFNYTHQPADPHSLSSNDIWEFLSDREGNLWIGSYFDGLNRTYRRGGAFTVYQHDPTLPNSLSYNKINHLTEDPSGMIWLGTTGGGVNRLNPRTGEITRFRHDPNNPNSLDHDHVNGIVSDEKGNIWMGTEAGLNKLDPQTGKFTHYNNRLDEPGSTSIKSAAKLYVDGVGKIWMGTVSSLGVLDPQSETFTRLTHDPENPHSINGLYIYQILESNDGHIWLRTEKGIDQVDPETKKVRRFPFEENVSTIAIGQDGNLWVGLLSEGLFHWNPQTNKRRKIPGIPGEHLMIHIQLDARGNVWVGTLHGLYKYDPQTDSVRHYNTHDGLMTNRFLENAGLLKKGTGELYFGTDEGLLVFHPDSLKDNPYVPPVVITAMTYYDSKGESGEPIEVKNITHRREIEFPHHQNSLTLTFAALSYSKTPKNQYAYRLSSHEGETGSGWNHLGTERRLSLPNLSPGTYYLRIKGSNGDGVWNETGTRLKIVIHPPWWWSLAAKTLYGLLVLGMLVGFYRWRTMEQRRRIAFQQKQIEQEQLVNVRLQKLDKLKDQFLANTSHELRTPLHGIVGLAESMFLELDVDQYRQNLGMIIASGKRLGSLVNDLLDFSKAKNEDLQLVLKPVGLRPMVEMVLQACYPLLGNKDVRLYNEVDGDLHLAWADENRLQQVLYNLIGNAVKFTESGSIKVLAREKRDVIELAVADTGIGIPQDKHAAVFEEFEQVDGSSSRTYAGTGLGLSISKKLVEIHGGNMWMESTPGKGSTFFFTLPKADVDAIALAPADHGDRRFFPLEMPTVPESAKSQGKTMFQPSFSENTVRVLIVDDEPINHQVIKNYLKSDHTHIYSAMSGREALEIIEREPAFDLMLLDIMMPRMNGYEVCQKIRESYLPSEMPIIMVTARTRMADLVQGFETGANDYITKPFSRDEFLARVKTQLNLHQINRATGRFVPAEFLKSIGRNSITEVRLGDQQQKEVTVFFSDIRAYSSLSETMSPDENFRFVNAYVGRMGPAIRKRGGFVHQYLGDGIMAIFQEGADKAILAAIEMQEILRKYNQVRKSSGRRELTVGMGLHSGPLIMGIIGDDFRTDAATIADAVNTASRMEGLTKIMGAKIILSEHTLKKLANPDQFQMRYLGWVTVKGKHQPIGIYECLNGEGPGIREKKEAGMAAFAQGLESYHARQFEQAAIGFRRVLSLHSSDKAAQYFLAKSANYMVNGVPETWTGVEVMEGK